MKDNPVLISQLVLESALEILGTASLQAVLNITGINEPFIEEKKIKPDLVFTLQDWEKIVLAVVSLFGERGGQGIILQSGRVFFKNYLRTSGFDLGLMDQNFRMLPKGKRIRQGLEILSRELSLPQGFTYSVIDDSSKWYWKIEYYSLNLENKPFYESFVIGLLQEFLSWTSGGKYYPIKAADELINDPSKSIIWIQKDYIS